MKIQAAIIILISLILTACNQNKPAESQIPVVGEAVDSAAIAQDTFGQKSLEASYEYAQTVIVNPKLVYDIRAYGGPASHGEYAILRRGADNKTDTVVMAERFGTIVNTFTADLNHNGKEEIYVVMRKTNRGASSYVSAFEFDKAGLGKSLIFGDSSKHFTINTPVAYDSINPNSDSIFISEDMITKSYPHDKNNLSGKLNHAWQLDGLNFKILPND